MKKHVEIDARGLMPPEPMVRILEALNQHPKRDMTIAKTDFLPLHLLDQLDRQGYKHESQEQPDGSWITHIIRKTSNNMPETPPNG